MSTAQDMVIDYLYDLAHQSFWGTVNLKYENGKIVHIVRQESIIPSKLNSKEEPKKNASSYGC